VRIGVTCFGAIEWWPRHTNRVVVPQCLGNLVEKTVATRQDIQAAAGISVSYRGCY
tara:strand:+ start:569 stop:736 length:168 start_codon:yes stop_codon:yes gene_type:complete